MNPEAQGAAIDGVARALSDGTRRSILRLVRDDERSAGELARQFPTISRPAVSQHLRVLHHAGLVTVRSDGNRRMYRARTEGLAEMWQYLDEMWTDRLGRLKVAAERADWPARQRRRLDPTRTTATTQDDRPTTDEEHL
jgi:DNA-binding transcriptional ArsR family regulator